MSEETAAGWGYNSGASPSATSGDIMGLLLLLCVFALWTYFVLCPLLAYLRTKELYGFVPGRGRKAVVIYYGVLLSSIACVVLALTANNGPAATLFDMFGLVAGAAIAVASLSGPFIGLDLVESRKNLPVNACESCGYNLTGNVSGVCPECGMAVTANRVETHPDQFSEAKRHNTYKRLGYVGLILLFGALLGYGQATVFECCSECGRRQVKTVHRMEIPVSGAKLVEIDGRAVLDRKSNNPMTAYLDPGGACSHNWISYSRSGGSFWTTNCGGMSDPSRVDPSDMPEFDAFLAANPGALDQFRADLRSYRWYPHPLRSRYYEWRDSRGGSRK